MRTRTILAGLLLLAACSHSGGKRAEPTTGGTFPDEGITSTTIAKAGVARLRVGETANLSVVMVKVGQVGAEAPMLRANVPGGKTVARQAVTKVKTNTGDEFDKPERGLYLGVYVKLYSLIDALATKGSGTLYVSMRGHRYDSTSGGGFSPDFNFTDLNAGEATEGWLVFDVPAAHGDVILADSFGGTKIATWRF
jgi:hypothetical protein